MIEDQNMAGHTVTHRQVNPTVPLTDIGAGIDGLPVAGQHPAGEIKHGSFAQTLRMVTFTIYIVVCSLL